MDDRLPGEEKTLPRRSEALPPDLPGASHAEVVAGPPGTVDASTPARAAVVPSAGDPALEARLGELERENRELWSLLREERRARLQEIERLTRMVELACHARDR